MLQASQMIPCGSYSRMSHGVYIHRDMPPGVDPFRQKRKQLQKNTKGLTFSNFVLFNVSTYVICNVTR